MSCLFSVDECVLLLVLFSLYLFMDIYRFCCRFYYEYQHAIANQPSVEDDKSKKEM